MSDTNESGWYEYSGGATIGQEGFAFGHIVRDEEWGAPGADGTSEQDDEDAPGPDARLTLEKSAEAWTLTATLYGWMSHTKDFREEGEARTTFEMMKSELPKLAALLPYEDEADMDAKTARLVQAIADLEARLQADNI